MVISFVYAHFDELCFRCISKEAVDGVEETSRELDPSWEMEIDYFGDLLDCIKAACPI